ncbi:MAG: NAD(P)(+) transhydrogenase (Re/Si-specific) subunit alpha [Chloroflexi bacterium]|nr:NAD(P)(+) transhydrogenase (Re/Si-specific) subunit alpha [Chloroflexota bacterium]MBK90179.1 NAD(P)(+) transhydrogenase (Re/Si-specific) subunit alpha [Chloroflexota bacterium]
MADNIILGVKKEEDPSENRVSIVPKDIKSIINLGISVEVEENSGNKAGYTNKEYESSGAKIVKKLSNKVSIVTGLNAFYNKKSDFIKNSSVISLTDVRTDQEISKICENNNLSLFAMEFVPRIARAQKLDALSSQASIAGYRAGLLAATSLKKYLPLMMTAAGTIPPSSILVLGAGVAGLQAIATAKRLGADVTGYDIRLAAGEQIESLGAKFISDEIPEDTETSGGYAKEQSKDTQTSQLEFLKEYILKSDAVISTAAIPGRKAPILIEKSTVEQMKPGSVIVDISAPSGGNCECTILGESVDVNGTLVHGPKNLSSEMAYDASIVYSKNIFGLLEIMVTENKLEINLEDEIIDAMLVFQDGKKRIEA